MSPEEIAEEIPVSGYEILTPTGFKPVTRALKSIPLIPWELKTTSYTLRCAGGHIVKTENILSWVQDLVVGELIETQTGLESVISVKQLSIAPEPMYDFTIDSEDHLYYTDGILSHNTVSLTARDTLMAQLLPGIKNTVITPRADQIATYANKLKEMESYFRCFEHHTNFRNNLFFKEYPNKSTIKLVNCLTTASNIRGVSSDAVSIDEIQDFDLSLEVELEEIQSASSFPSTIYSGTSLRTDSALEAKWNRSSRGIWTMKCGCCNHYNQPIPECNVMDMIQPDGPCCAKCGRPLDVTHGQWIHESPNLLAIGRKGLHVPKIIVPDIANNPFKWNRIYMQSKTIDQRKFFQEILGIATEEGEREISLKQLEAICNLGDSEKLKQKAINQGYRYVISGCDWGGSDYVQSHGTKTSFTVHVMLGVTNTGQMDIIHMRQYSGMNYRDVAGDIIYNHKRLKGFAMGSDFGVGMQYNNYLREHIVPNRHFILGYVGPHSAMFASPKGEHMFNQYSLNKTESITMLYEAIKRHRLQCYCWQEAGERLSEFLNLIRAPHESAAGNTTFRYIRHGSKPDDTLHAINFAYTVARLALGEPLFEDRSLMIHIDKMLQESATDPFGGAQYVTG